VVDLVADLIRLHAQPTLFAVTVQSDRNIPAKETCSLAYSGVVRKTATGWFGPARCFSTFIRIHLLLATIRYETSVFYSY